MTDLSHTLLGRSVEHEPRYAPSLLMPIARAPSRAALGVGEHLPFVGSDRWTGYELCWLEPGGKPRIAVLRCVVPCGAPNLIESKSFKLYLNSYAQERMQSATAVSARIGADLSLAAGAEVAVELIEPRDFSRLQPLDGNAELLDDLPIEVADYAEVQSKLLTADAERLVDESLCSHLLKSNCPVTGQPDWASVFIRYRGGAVDRAGLLRYLVSFRQVREFHEQCVERIYLDLWTRLAPEFLAVEARYTRRGGLDINPYRASAGPAVVADCRQWRQ